MTLPMRDDATLDRAGAVRAGLELPLEPLTRYLAEHIEGFTTPEVHQFRRGHSNLTYLLVDGHREFVLRRPPFGANVPTGHDMGREFRILSALSPHWDKAPTPYCFCDDTSIIGAPFYVMERVKGVILRQAKHPGLTLDEAYMSSACQTLVRTMAEVHALDVEEVGLSALGRPEGYITRQVEGWTRRYQRAKTDTIESVEQVARWLADHRPAEGPPTVIHNDYKYDNLVLSLEGPGQALAVLDWEMCTVADPLMDLGTSLAYWFDPDDPAAMRMLPFGPTLLPGNLNRQGVIEAYQQATGREVLNPVFYYVYGLFKVVGIAQQIYARFKAGHSTDKRFAMMIEAVRLLGAQAKRAIDAGRVHSIG